MCGDLIINDYEGIKMVKLKRLYTRVMAPCIKYSPCWSKDVSCNPPRPQDSGCNNTRLLSQRSYDKMGGRDRISRSW